MNDTQLGIRMIEPAIATAEKPRLPRNVVLVGMTSLFTDIASEMLYPLIQAFVAMIMVGQKALLGPVLGLIEGIAESTASLLKVFAGYYSDKVQNRKGFAITGYGLSFLSRFLLLASSLGWYFVLLFRFVDRTGKGIRTAPRDAIVSDSTPNGIQGKAFGFHRAMDFGGAFIGVLICYLVTLKYLDPVTKTLRDIGSFYTLFALSLIPAFVGLVFLFLLKEPQVHKPGKLKPRPNLDIRAYNKNLKIFFLATLFFTLGNSSNQFLLLRSQNLGFSLSSVILMYMFFNLVPTLSATLFGSLSDRIGRKRVIVSGYLVYGIVYLSFGFITKETNWLLWIFWVVYGIYYSMCEGVEKALVSELAPAESKATALGFFATIVGVGLLPASLIAGLLFAVSPRAPFVFGGAMSLISMLMIAFLVREARPSMGRG